MSSAGGLVTIDVSRLGYPHETETIDFYRLTRKGRDKFGVWHLTELIVSESGSTAYIDGLRVEAGELNALQFPDEAMV